MESGDKYAISKIDATRSNVSLTQMVKIILRENLYET